MQDDAPAQTRFELARRFRTLALVIGLAAAAGCLAQPAPVHAEMQVTRTSLEDAPSGCSGSHTPLAQVMLQRDAPALKVALDVAFDNGTATIQGEDAMEASQYLSDHAVVPHCWWWIKYQASYFTGLLVVGH